MIISKRPRLTVLLIGVLLLTALNLLVGAWTHRLFYYKKLEEIRTARNPSLLFLGNSLLDTTVDNAALVEAARNPRLKPLNAALGGTLPPEHRLLCEYALRTQPNIRTIVVGFYDFQITEPDNTRVSDLVGNRMVGIDQRFPIAEVASAYAFGPLDDLEIQGLRLLPIVANRGNAVAYFEMMRRSRYVERLRRSMESMSMLHVDPNTILDADGLPVIESADFDSFDASARAFIDHPDRFNPSYEAIFDKARDAGVNAVLLVMPVSPFHRAAYYSRSSWRDYLAALERLAARRNIRVIDASDWQPLPADFEDHLHMNRPGGHRFSMLLGSELSREGYQ
jgi:hypothetical protein